MQLNNYLILFSKENPVLDECVTCWACNTYCPNDAHPCDLILERLETRGYECSPALKTVVDVHDHPKRAPSYIVTGDTGGPVINVCNYRERIPGLFEGQLFEKATLLVGGDYETMLVREHIAQVTKFKEELPKKIKNINTAACNKAVVFMHDDCY